MIWFIAIVACVVWLLLGLTIMGWINGKMEGDDHLDPDERSDRTIFRFCVVCWPGILALFCCLELHDRWNERPKGSRRGDRTAEFFRQGGVSGKYLRWKERH